MIPTHGTIAEVKARAYKYLGTEAMVWLNARRYLRPEGSIVAPPRADADTGARASSDAAGSAGADVALPAAALHECDDADNGSTDMIVEKMVSHAKVPKRGSSWGRRA